ncbi:MAG: 30S ribosomal protein S8 [Puniceicoccales bacterium]|jgi:small subunit ribosomal protein S8|nr:30S ribosomal protein S8 [Puniceicoccales bacterium]
MDTVGDFLTIIRNAVNVRKATCVVAFSKIREGILCILKNVGFIEDFHIGVCEKGLRCITITLRYDENGMSPIRQIVRCSKPGQRIYCEVRTLPRVLNGLGIAILSTSRGIMRDTEARRQNVGGELLCEVW